MAAKNVRLVQRRRRDAKCAVAGCKELSGSDFRCPDHAAEHAERMARYRRDRKAS